MSHFGRHFGGHLGAHLGADGASPSPQPVERAGIGGAARQPRTRPRWTVELSVQSLLTVDIGFEIIE